MPDGSGLQMNHHRVLGPLGAHIHGATKDGGIREHLEGMAAMFSVRSLDDGHVARLARRRRLAAVRMLLGRVLHGHSLRQPRLGREVELMALRAHRAGRETCIDDDLVLRATAPRRRVHTIAIVDVAAHAANPDRLRRRGRLESGIALGRMAATTERDGLDGVRFLEDRISPRLAMHGSRPLNGDVAVATHAGRVLRDAARRVVGARVGLRNERRNQRDQEQHQEATHTHSTRRLSQMICTH